MIYGYKLTFLTIVALLIFEFVAFFLIFMLFEVLQLDNDYNYRKLIFYLFIYKYK